MATDLKNYDPALMYGATVSNAGETVTGNETVSGTLAVTGATTLSSTLAAGATTITGAATVTAAVTAKSATAVPATAGAVAAGAPFVFNTGALTIEATSDVPSHTRPAGSLCINTGGSSSSTRLYVSAGAGSWIAITTAS